MFATSYYHFTATDSKMQGWRHRNLPSPEADAFVEERTNRWSGAIEDARCLKILQALFVTSAFNPRFALSGRTIGRLTGLHHQIIRRLIRGDKHCRAKLIGLVSWLEGKGRRGTRYWLTPEGAKLAELLANGFQVGKATLIALATDRWRQKTAHLAKMAQQNGTPSLNTMPSYNGFNNVCSPPADSALKPVGQKPVNGLAERLWQDYGVVLKVANDLVARYSPTAIEAAITLREQRNGAIYNGAGFIVYLLRKGYAQAYAQACRQACQRPRNSPGEPDFDGIVRALRDALAPYGVRVDDEGFAEMPNGRLWLPPNPDEAIDLLRRIGILRNDKLNATANATNPTSGADSATNDALDVPADATEPTGDAPSDKLWANDDDFKSPAIDDLDYQNEPMEADLSDDDDDESEPLPQPKCDCCGRLEGEPHPALWKGQANSFLVLSCLSDTFKQHFGLPECGLLCRGCYMTLCMTLTLSDKAGSLSNEGQTLITLTEDIKSLSLPIADPSFLPKLADESADAPTDTKPINFADGAPNGHPDPKKVYTWEGDKPPEPTCQRWGRKEGKYHPKLLSDTQNSLAPISNLIEATRKLIELEGCEFICRGYLNRAMKEATKGDAKEEDDGHG